MFVKTIDFFQNIPLENDGKELNYKEFSKILKHGETETNERREKLS
jgi:hypothetical protein